MAIIDTKHFFMCSITKWKNYGIHKSKCDLKVSFVVLSLSFEITLTFSLVLLFLPQFVINFTYSVQETSLGQFMGISHAQ